MLKPEPYKDRLASFDSLLQKVLPNFEYRYFHSSPLSYVSANFLFRGMSMKKYNELLNENYLIPKYWDLWWWEAVFTTNNISEALWYVGGNTTWAIAIIPRKWVEWKTPDRSVLIGSTRYKVLINQLLEMNIDDKLAVYRVENELDLERRQSPINGDHRMVMIRPPQNKQTSGMRFIVWDNDAVFLD